MVSEVISKNINIEWLSIYSVLIIFCVIIGVISTIKFFKSKTVTMSGLYMITIMIAIALGNVFYNLMPICYEHVYLVNINGQIQTMYCTYNTSQELIKVELKEE